MKHCLWRIEVRLLHFLVNHRLIANFHQLNSSKRSAVIVAAAILS